MLSYQVSKKVREIREIEEKLDDLMFFNFLKIAESLLLSYVMSRVLY